MVAGLAGCCVLGFRLFWRDRGDWTRVPRSTWLVLVIITSAAIALAQGIVWTLGTVVVGLGVGFVLRALLTRRGRS